MFGVLEKSARFATSSLKIHALYARKFIKTKVFLKF